MERLQKALEKAKEQRKLAGAPVQKPIPVAADTITTAATEKSATTSFPEKIDYTNTRVLEVSEKVLQENRIIAGIDGHPQADVFRVLRTKILHTMRQQGINSLAVTSPHQGCGKSVVAANLAIALAMEANQTVMLVDLDLRRPSIHKYFGFNPILGLADYLLDGEEIADLLIHPSIERLVILPAGRALPQSSELLSTPRMLKLIKEITNRYASRIIVFDIPPLLGLDDALTFLPQVHASLLVVEEGVSTKEEIQQSMRLMEGTGLLGTVYNKAKQVKHLPY